MTTQNLTISPRSTMLKKRDLEQARLKEGRLPASLYGKSLGESFPIFVETKTTRVGEFTQGHMFRMKWQGKPVLATVKQVQRDPVSRNILHMSLHAVKSDEMITVDLPLNFVGEAVGDKSGGILFTQRDKVSIEALPGDLIDAIDVDISGLEIGDSITLADIRMPKGIELREQDLEQPVIVCRPPKSEAEMEMDTTESVPEVIEQDTTEEKAE